MNVVFGDTREALNHTLEVKHDCLISSYKVDGVSQNQEGLSRPRYCP
jgi:hypothetical protein